MQDLFAACRFVLVEPSHPGNVGAAARALKTMGFARLVLVNPRQPGVSHDPQAQAMASGAGDVLERSLEVDSLDAALAGTCWSLALSARQREYGPPPTAPRAAAARLAQSLAQGEVALVFGNERAGLSNLDLERCSALAHIPANPEYASLNLAQAVQLLAYELRLTLLQHERGAAAAEPADAASASTHDVSNCPPADVASGGIERPATFDEIEKMFAHIEQALVAIEFLDPANPKKLMQRLRRLFARSALHQEEVNILRGIAKQILSKTRR